MSTGSRKLSITIVAWLSTVCLILAVGVVGLVAASSNGSSTKRGEAASPLRHPGSAKAFAELLGYRIDDWKSHVVAHEQDPRSRAVVLYRGPGRDGVDDVPFAAALIVPEGGNLENGLGTVQLYVFTGSDSGSALLALKEVMGFEITEPLTDPTVSAAVERAAWFVEAEELGRWRPFSRLSRFPTSSSTASPADASGSRQLGSK